MAIYSVSTPGFYQLMAAYNPITITALTSGTNPLVYFDIYMNGVYYKTLTSTSPVGNTGGFNVWTVDVNDATQEYMSAKIPDLGGPMRVLPLNIATGLVIQNVKVRGSSVTGGFTVPDGPIPVQGTMDNAPVPGAGMSAFGPWVVMNAAIQREENPDLSIILANNNVGYLAAGYGFYNLFRNPSLRVTKDNYLRLPIFIPHGGLVGPGPGPVPSANYYLVIEDESGRLYYFMQASIPPTYATYATYAEVYAYYLPAGPANFAGLTAVNGTFPINTTISPDWQTIKRYRVGLTTNAVLATLPTFRWKSPWIKVDKPCADTKRFQFVNWLGHYDTIVFDEHIEEYQVKSAGWQQYNSLSFDWMGKQAFSKQRYNVRSNELITATGYFSEAEMPHVKQFLSNPRCYIERKGDSIGTGTPDYLMPVRLVDVTAQTRKIEERWFYEITVQAEPSVERINIRN